MAVNINVPSQVKTYANLAAFPASGSLKTIYIAEDTNKTYRWTGSVYVEISASAAMTWGQIGGTLSNQTDLQNALDAKVPTTRTLTINGTTQDLSADRTFTISTGITIGTTAITSGTVGRVLFQGTGNVVQQSSSLFWDNTNGRLGIGTSSPADTLDITYDPTSTSGARLTTTVGTSGLFNNISFYHLTAFRGSFGVNNQSGEFRWNAPSGGYYPTIYSNGSERLRIASTGNVLIGTTTDAGFRLDVNGTARVQNTTTITKGASNYITFEPSANGTSPFLDMFFSGQVSTRISLGTTSSTRVFLFRDLGTALGMGIDCGAIFSNSNAILIGGAEQKVQIAGTTNNYLQFTQAGTASRGTIGYAAGQSYMQIRVNAATDLATGTLSTAFFSTGNVGINTTTDAGFRLDVNGTARVSGNTTFGGTIGSGGSSNFVIAAGNFAVNITSTDPNNGQGSLITTGSITKTDNQTKNIINVNNAVTSTAANFNTLNGFAFTSTINQTLGTIRGIYIAPTLTASTDFRAIETTAGRVIFGGLPTSSAGLPTGAIWNDAGTLKIV